MSQANWVDAIVEEQMEVRPRHLPGVPEAAHAALTQEQRIPPNLPWRCGLRRIRLDR